MFIYLKLINWLKNFTPYFHIVNPSPWPLYTAWSIFAFMSATVTWFQGYSHSTEVVIYTLVGLTLILGCWWRDIIRESTYEQKHNVFIRRGLLVGMLLFILSEACFFAAFFLFSFYFSPVPAASDGVWLPIFIDPNLPWILPALNTVLLLLSGAAITRPHRVTEFGLSLVSFLVAKSASACRAINLETCWYLYSLILSTLLVLFHLHWILLFIYHIFEPAFIAYVFIVSFKLYLEIALFLVEIFEKLSLIICGFLYFLMGKVFRNPILVLHRAYYFCAVCYAILFTLSLASRVYSDLVHFGIWGEPTCLFPEAANCAPPNVPAELAQSVVTNLHNVTVTLYHCTLADISDTNCELDVFYAIERLINSLIIVLGLDALPITQRSELHALLFEHIGLLGRECSGIICDSEFGSSAELARQKAYYGLYQHVLTRFICLNDALFPSLKASIQANSLLKVHEPWEWALDHFFNTSAKNPSFLLLKSFIAQCSQPSEFTNQFLDLVAQAKASKIPQFPMDSLPVGDSFAGYPVLLVEEHSIKIAVHPEPFSKSLAQPEIRSAKILWKQLTSATSCPLARGPVSVYSNSNNCYRPELVVVGGGEGVGQYASSTYPLKAKFNAAEFDVKVGACLDKLSASAPKSQGYWGSFLYNFGLDNSTIVMDQNNKNTLVSQNIAADMAASREAGKARGEVFWTRRPSFNDIE